MKISVKLTLLFFGIFLVITTATSVFTLIVISLFSLLVLLLFSRTISKPLIELRDAANEIGKGKLDVKIRVKSNDETGELAAGFIQMLKNLRETTVSRDYVDNILSSMNDALFVIWKDGTIRSVNQAASNLLGYTEDELRNQPFHDIFEEHRQNPLSIDEFINKDLALDPEKTLLTKDGRKISVLFSCSEMRGNEQDMGNFVCVAMDITQQKKTEEERVRLARTVEQTGESIFITDTNGRIQYVNPAFVRITGYTSKEVVGKNPNILMSENQDSTFSQRIREPITKGEVWRGHFTNKKKDGSLYEVDSIISPVIDSFGKTINFVTIQHDVTSELQSKQKVIEQMEEIEKYSDVLLSILEDSDKANKELKSAYSELKQKQAQLIQKSKLASIGELAAGVAHELNQPLMVIRGFTQMMLKQENQYDEKTQRNLEIFEKSTSRMMTIINHLKNFSRKPGKNPSAFCVHNAIDDALHFVEKLLKSNEIIVEKNYQSDLPMIKIDGNQLEQVILNLISNARDALNEYEEKQLDAVCEGKKEWKKLISIETEYTRENNRVRIEFSDTGGGMPEEYLGRIFDPFFTSKEEGKGTGLGLSISYGIVKDHKGEIEAFNSESGAVFRISFPAVEESQTTPEHSAYRDGLH